MDLICDLLINQYSLPRYFLTIYSFLFLTFLYEFKFIAIIFLGPTAHPLHDPALLINNLKGSSTLHQVINKLILSIFSLRFCLKFLHHTVKQIYRFFIELHLIWIELNILVLLMAALLKLRHFMHYFLKYLILSHS